MTDETKTFPCGHVGVLSTDGHLEYCRRCRADGKDGHCPGHPVYPAGIVKGARDLCMGCERPLNPRPSAYPTTREDIDNELYNLRQYWHSMCRLYRTTKRLPRRQADRMRELQKLLKEFPK